MMVNMQQFPLLTFTLFFYSGTAKKKKNTINKNSSAQAINSYYIYIIASWCGISSNKD